MAKVGVDVRSSLGGVRSDGMHGVALRGSGLDDRRWMDRCLDDAGGLLHHVLAGVEYDMLFSLIPSRPRVARPASRLHNSLKTIVQVIVLWSLALGFVPFAISWCERWMSWPGFPSRPWCGGAIFVIAGAIGYAALGGVEVAPSGLLFYLRTKHAACLALGKRGIDGTGCC
jgi:hypothetical protein